MIQYRLPDRWAAVKFQAIAMEFIDAKATVQTLKSLPFQRDWVLELQKQELRREVAGTSRIEGADFTERELDEALKESPGQLRTRSQRQARAAAQTYRWLAAIPDDRPIDAELILEIHRKLVTGADDDHCPPGRLRGQDENVNFGSPRHRGAEGGAECENAFARLVQVIQREFTGIDPLLRGPIAHYHLAAIHPFKDGNGRTARALEALLLQRAGLRDICFIALSNYYDEEKRAYLEALNASQAAGHDLAPFLRFTLTGVASQATRLSNEIRRNLERTVFRDLMYDLFTRLESPRKKVIGKRQIEILKTLLHRGPTDLGTLLDNVEDRGLYASLKNQRKALKRDLIGLRSLGAIDFDFDGLGLPMLRINYDWPEQITQTEFYERTRNMSKAKSLISLR